MNSNAKVVAGAVALVLPLAYFLRKSFTSDEHTTAEQILGRSDISEESVEEEEESDEDSDEDLPAEDRDLSENELVLQLLHLLRISLEVHKIENVKIALRELVSQSRFVKMQDEMIDSGVFELLATSIKSSDDEVALESSKLLGNLASNYRGLQECRPFVPLILGKMSEMVQDAPSAKYCQASDLFVNLAKTTANMTCDYDTKYEAHYQEFCRAIVKLEFDLDFFAETLMKIMVNLSAQPVAREMLLESGIISLVEDFVCGSEEAANPKKSDSLLRCLYCVHNILTCRDPSASYWRPCEATVAKLSLFSNSLDASPSVVEKAMSINKVLHAM